MRLMSAYRREKRWQKCCVAHVGRNFRDIPKAPPTSDCCGCDDPLPWGPGHYMNYRCLACGHEMHLECATFVPGGRGRPPGYVCQCCEPPPESDTDEEDDSDTTAKK